MEPDTLIRPHRHPQTWELLLPLRGRFIVLHFDEWPYKPISNKDFAPWGSGEGEPLAPALLKWYESARLGDRLVE